MRDASSLRLQYLRAPRGSWHLAGVTEAPAVLALTGRPLRLFLIGATGTIGRAIAQALLARGHEVVCFVRPTAGKGLIDLAGAEIRFGDVTDLKSVERDGFKSERFDAVVSCLASRTGAPGDVWAIDYAAQLNVLNVAKSLGVDRVILLSAICLQKPKLAFQHAKIAFEEALIGSGLSYTIVRPTAFFKSLSGQVKRVQRGKPWLLFGDGMLTACKPISDEDLAAFLVRCVEDSKLRNRVLPIGGPGPAITPKEQADALFALLGREPRYRHVPVRLMDIIIAMLTMLGRVSRRLRDKAELARIGRYYATESMLVLDQETGRYDAQMTPSTGTATLLDHYARLVRDKG